MKNKNVSSQKLKIGGGLLAGLLAPSLVHACACGCGVFDVGGNDMFPSTGEAGMAYFQYAYQDQDHNWSGSSKAPAANNGDKEIETSFLSLGVQKMFNRSWGIQVELPYDNRTFKTVTGNPNVPAGTVARMNWWALGDLRVEGIYTGFFPDMSAGLIYGLKLPTGDWKYNDTWGDVDRDSEIGSGSLDALIGGFYRGNLGKNQQWDWYIQTLAQLPIATQDEYRPGNEIDSALGIDYKGFTIGRARVSPVAQVIFSERTSDGGAEASGGLDANPAGGVNSGYQRLMLSPGVEVHIHPFKVYADAEIPVWQYFKGNQLVAPVLFKLNISFMF